MAKVADDGMSQSSDGLVITASPRSAPCIVLSRCRIEISPVNGDLCTLSPTYTFTIYIGANMSMTFIDYFKFWWFLIEFSSVLKINITTTNNNSSK